MTNLISARPDRKVSPLREEMIAEALSLAIHEHRLHPGTKLGEDDLAEIYGVSRTIVRAALKTLAHRQLVEIKRNRGAFVAQPSPQEAREVFEARELLEPRTARTAALRASAEDIAILRNHIADEHAAIAAKDRGKALFLSGLFHNEIARIAGQETVAEFIVALMARSSLIVALYWRRESALCESHAHHALIAAIADHDGQRAEDLMRSHLVDLHAMLDLRHVPSQSVGLKDILG